MSIVAYDGRIVAADRQSTNSDTRREVQKIFLIDTEYGKEIVAFVGCMSGGLAMMEWYENGADPSILPQSQNTDSGAVLSVFHKDGVDTYENHIPMPINDPFWAWGSGRDIALGAMAHGANAIEAVEIASRFNIDCGMGIDYFILEEVFKEVFKEDIEDMEENNGE